MEDRIYNLATLKFYANLLCEGNCQVVNMAQIVQVFRSRGYDVIRLDDNCFQLKRIED